MENLPTESKPESLEGQAREGLAAVNCSGFERCADCTDDMCAEIKQCIGQIYLDQWKEEEEYIAKGVCSDCGACSLKDAEGKCKPRPLGDTGDYICAGEKLWEDEQEE